MDDKMIDVHYEDINKKYYTIDEVANILKIEQSSIVFYFEKLNDFLNIKSVGIYQLFDDTDVKNLKRIRDLEIDQHMTIKEIKKYLLQNKQEVLLEKESNNTVDQSVLNIFQTFANAMIEQNNKMEKMQDTNVQLVKSFNEMILHQDNIEKELLEQKEFNQKQLKEYSKNNKNLLSQLDDVKKELALSKNSNKKIENGLKEQSLQIQKNFDNSTKIIKKNIESINEFKCVTSEQINKQQESKGIVSDIVKLFHKKK